MKSRKHFQTLALLALMAAGAASTQAMAQVSFNIQVGPPAPLYEAVPMMSPGYVWAPGYWAWHGDRHIWVHGRSIVQRTGYRWQPDQWEQRGPAYYRQEGRWERDGDRDGRGNGNNGNRGRGHNKDR